LVCIFQLCDLVRYLQGQRLTGLAFSVAPLTLFIRHETSENSYDKA